MGKTAEDQQRNAALLSDYDYAKYPTGSLTGYTSQDLQRVAFLHWQHAVRTRVGSRGNYKAGLTRLPNGRLLLAACHSNHDKDPSRRRFLIAVYESADQGLTWQEIGETPLFGKEPSLTALPDGSLVLTAQKDYFGPGARLDEINIARSGDGGRTWETQTLAGSDYPRNMIVEPDGTLLMIRALESGWSSKGQGSPNLQLCRSRDRGKTWQFSEGSVDWDYSGFGEVSAVRLRSGRLLAALRRQIPGTRGEGFEDTVLTESSDEGKHWSEPRPMVNTAEVHVHLTELTDGRVLATYSNYHLPWGVYAVVSNDEGESWDLDHPIQLALSADIYVGWPVTLQLADGSLITSYAITAYLKQPPETTVTEVVRWEMPAVDLATVKDNAVAGCRVPALDARTTDHTSSRVDEALSRMTLDDKVGMLLMVRLDKATLEPFLRDYRCGSLLVWGNINPINDVAELCSLANQAQALSLEHRSLPVWLHGWAPGLGWQPDWISRAAQTVGPAEVQQAAAVFGRRWRAVGLHNLPQPCLNVPLHPTGIMLKWAISTDPQVVSRYGFALTRGVLSARCGTMAQHFPAHGAAALDSHTAFPVVDLPWDELWRDHLACYQACFDAGCTTLCTAHLACLALDPDRTQIATTSPRVLTDFLRGEMRFRGIVIADALEMRGFQKNGPLEQVAVDAVIAGCDSLCIVEPRNVKPVFSNLLQAARRGRITPERLNEAVKRHLVFMEWLGLFEKTTVSVEEATKLLQNKADNAFLGKVTGGMHQ